MSKNSRKASPYQRRPPSRPLRESFLILCEGKNTEPEYFNAFRLATAAVRALSVTSGDAMAVVKAAIKRRNAENEKGKKYDHYWVVFDKDDTTNDTFNAAISLAEKEGFQVAYSNQAFELWFLLHFEYLSGPLHRNQYANRLSDFLPFAYNKEKGTARKLFEVLLSRQPQAIENARKIWEQHADGKTQNPATEESSTTVHALIESLRRFL